MTGKWHSFTDSDIDKKTGEVRLLDRDYIFGSENTAGMPTPTLSRITAKGEKEYFTVRYEALIDGDWRSFTGADRL